MSEIKDLIKLLKKQQDEDKNPEFVEYEIPISLDSGNTSTSQITTSDGSEFIVNLEVPLVIPKTARHCWITVYGGTIWYNTFNVQAGVNDQIRIGYDPGAGFVWNTFTVSPGLYDLAHLNAEIQRLVNNFGWPVDLIVLEPNTATEKVVVKFNYVDTQIDFTIANTFREILGFDSRLAPLAVTTLSPQYENGDNQAQFNQVNYYLIHSDLVLRGIRINDTYQQIIAKVPITVKPGSQIPYAPDNPPRIPSHELIGTKLKTLTMWLTDDANNRIDTNGQPWSVDLVIHYLAPTGHR